MTRLIRMLMQVLVARLLAWGPIAGLWEVWGPELGISQDAIVDWATVFAIGVLVGLAEWAKRSEPTAKVLEWWNLIISWGQSKSDPEYVPVKAPIDDYDDGYAGDPTFHPPNAGDPTLHPPNLR